MADRETGRPPRCGYGLLGLCCTACLSGPCRRSPFDQATGGGRCGEDSDWIVGHNLAEGVSRESLRLMASFRDALERTSGPADAGRASRREAMELLISPFFRGKSPLLEQIYPERAFPFLHSLGALPGSWCAALLDKAAARPGTRDSEAQLGSSLRLAALALAAEELRREIAGADAVVGSADVELPETPSPLLILVWDGEGLPDDDGCAVLGEVEAACRERVGVVRLQDIGQLGALARSIYARWGVPASLTGSLAVVASPSLVPGMGALALGFSLAALPGYPLQGSPRVEGYLTRDLKASFGHAYLPLHPDEELGEQIMRGLTP